MKKTILIIATLCLAMNLQAKTFFDQLVEYNPNWKKYGHRAPNQKARKFKTDAQYVQAHLTEVLYVLESSETKHLTTDQLKSRRNMIEILRGYRDRGLFPINEYHENRTPVFIDKHNTHCAVGYLLKESGHAEVASRISRNHNYDWLINIKDKALPGWQESSGFTLEELKLIQGAYDFYQPGAFYAKEKYDIPQQPKVVKAGFERKEVNRWSSNKEKNVWCYGEGENGILHGKWIQNYSSKLPWIRGFFNMGKRTGQWKEYYQGTDVLCRTEHWREDKLNGMRTRYDRSGNIIEEILFADGKAVIKTNYDYNVQLKWVRRPMETGELNTEVFTLSGSLLARGIEVVDNPDNLEWFQNIELTALNSAAIAARDGQTRRGRQALFEAVGPNLVKYNRKGDWTFYTKLSNPATPSLLTKRQEFNRDFPLLGHDLHHFFNAYSDKMLIRPYNRIQVSYKESVAVSFIGFHNHGIKRLVADYYWPEVVELTEEESALLIKPIIPHYFIDRYHMPYMRIKYVGEINDKNQKIGSWAHYDERGNLCRKEEFVRPAPYLEQATVSN